MKISGFSFVRNAVKFYYPVEESIRSVLPLCDEFIIAVGRGDADDTTRDVIAGIGDPKIKIIDTEWGDSLENLVFAEQTNIALEACTGDWCFYIQSDEVVHEDDHPVIRKRCEDILDSRDVDGLIFDYMHFWGDYDHCQTGHGWYRKEIRIVRNGIGISSRHDAQSFRLGNGKKLQVASANARMFHYGWVRPPYCMQAKRKAMETTYHGRKTIDEKYRNVPEELDYGPLGRLERYGGTHPAVMRKRIAELDWKDRLRDADPPGMKRRPHKDEKIKYRFVSAIERLTGLDLNRRNWRKELKV